MSNTKQLRPENDAEVFFLALPYNAPRHAKQIAFLMDNGSTKADILKNFRNHKEHPFYPLIVDFVEFYTDHRERARELMMPYSVTDYSLSEL